MIYSLAEPVRVNQCLTTGDYYYYRGTDSELNTLHLELFGHHRSPEGQVRIYYYYYYNFFFFSGDPFFWVWSKICPLLCLWLENSWKEGFLISIKFLNLFFKSFSGDLKKFLKKNNCVKRSKKKKRSGKKKLKFLEMCFYVWNQEKKCFCRRK